MTLAETTPVLEAANLQADLRRAGIEPWAWVINTSVAAASVHSPLLRQRAANELHEIECRRHYPCPTLCRRTVAQGRAGWCGTVAGNGCRQLLTGESYEPTNLFNTTTVLSRPLPDVVDFYRNGGGRRHRFCLPGPSQCL